MQTLSFIVMSLCTEMTIKLTLTLNCCAFAYNGKGIFFQSADSQSQNGLMWRGKNEGTTFIPDVNTVLNSAIVSCLCSSVLLLAFLSWIRGRGWMKRRQNNIWNIIFYQNDLIHKRIRLDWCLGSFKDWPQRLVSHMHREAGLVFPCHPCAS